MALCLGHLPPVLMTTRQVHCRPADLEELMVIPVGQRNVTDVEIRLLVYSGGVHNFRSEWAV